MRRDIGATALLFTSVGSVIGSGWLLGSLNATKIAGPAAIISWVVGAAAVMLLAFVHAELGAMSPVGGGNARFPHFAFGSLVGFGMGWIYWLGAVTLAPVEVEAALQYSNKYVDQWFGFAVVHEVAGQTVLTAAGYGVAAVLMAMFTVLNLWGVSRLAKANTVIVWWKILVPFVAVFALVITQFKTSNFTAGDGFAPAGLKGILSAMATGGVLFAYQGFEQAVQFGGESSNPRRNVPLAVLGSMIVGTVLYLLLQLAFVGALDPASAKHGWANLSFTNDVGPFAGLATALGLGWLATVLYIDAVVSPGGTGLVYTGASARISYGLGRNGYIPHTFDRLSKRGVPWISVIFAFAVGMIVFLPFPGWQKLVAFITSASLIIYAAQCVSVAALRRQLPDITRPFRVPGLALLAPASFVIANLIVLFSGWTTYWKLLAAVGIGFVLLAVSNATRPREQRTPLDWRAGSWMIPWLLGLGVISYLASFDGGKSTLKFGVDMIVCAVFSLAVYYLALRLRLPSGTTERYFEQTAEEAAES
ncbi:MAG TPA: APC family permease [Thermoleophilaceae bacterium]|nr:APC family permease [Thermoleophilaceae bacterium]